MYPKNGPRIAVVQFSPKFGQVEANLIRAKEICSGIKPRSVDLVCFPEMILSGYVFEDSTEILPYLEYPRTGPTSQMCADIAQRLQCYVVAGYPERLVDSDETRNRDIGANSAVLYGPSGEWIGNHRKINLFPTDRSWAKAGVGFQTFQLPPPIGRLSLGICMDLNAHPPADWQMRGPPHEIADYVLEQDVEILIFLNAWLDSEVYGYENEGIGGGVVDWTTVDFWAARLNPLWEKDSVDSGNGDKVTSVVVCNRTGKEKGRLFAGSSTCFNMRRGSGKPEVLDVMGRREEGFRIMYRA
ncbi:hydrolase [Rhodocollybia butyracea]|uniref:Hydrolase n=1 Tax=Rhodocollybia butyracea TaxID=206335 RepID=A0A9P5Q5T7_9AGAR|nr:hydrolase [Rhodocollybia butyracea]